jgi:hypothetical protein
MRVATVIVLIAVVLAAAPAALAQDDIGRAASDLPTTLFEPAPEGVPRGARIDDGDGASLVVAGMLVAVALTVGYLVGSSSRTRRS